jgi:hypothetical protein
VFINLVSIVCQVLLSTFSPAALSAAPIMVNFGILPPAPLCGPTPA